MRTIHSIPALILMLTLLAAQAFAGTYTVTTTADTGPGSLREAMTYANANPGTTIAFDIPTTDPGYSSGYWTIKPLSALPTITANGTILDGSTQTTNQGDTNPAGPEIMLDGSSAGSTAAGIPITSADCIVKGLVVGRFSAGGIVLSGTGAARNSVVGCYVGTDRTGTTSMGNAVAGILLTSNAHDNVIGGNNAAMRNVVSGNTFRAITLTNSHSNIIAGNFIGTNPTGMLTLPNAGIGVFLEAGSHDNIIGGTDPGAGNVVSNCTIGIALTGSGTDRNVIKGNKVGTDAVGTAAMGNSSHGIQMSSGPSYNLVGGREPGARNNISGNGGSGIALLYHGTTSNIVQGNYIGTDSSGNVSLGNEWAGVYVNGARFTLIGGLGSNACNLISGNQDGIEIDDFPENYGVASGDGTVIQGNRIGTNAAGASAIPNGSGVDIRGSGTHTTIGGPSPGAGNLISGNGCAVYAYPSAATIIVQGNLIGTDVSGSVALPNWTGIRAGGSDNTFAIGGEMPSEGNVISGNTYDGVQLWTSNCTVAGNFIGTNETGESAVPNGRHGIWVQPGVEGTIVGWASPGARNVISGNGGWGICADEYYSGVRDIIRNAISGNVIGTDATGTRAIGNVAGGIYILKCGGYRIGGSLVGEGNLISGNPGPGIRLGASTYDILIRGNRVGTDMTGNSPLPNGGHGIELLGGTDNIVGGPSPGEGNVISGNGMSGVYVNCSANRIIGNAIGAGADGTTAVPNTQSGVDISVGATGNRIGGMAAGEGNLISGNLGSGIYIHDNPGQNLIQGNRVGTNALGASALGNAQHGVDIRSSSGNTVGANVISGNGQDGICIAGPNAADSTVQGNRIGSDANGGSAVPNGGAGIRTAGGTVGAVIGGIDPGAGNLVLAHSGPGVFVSGAQGTLVYGNVIGLNSAGTNMLGAAQSGLVIADGSTGTIVGGPDSAMRNIICGSGIGVDIYGQGTSNNQVIGNHIGTDNAGELQLGNNTGICLSGGTSANVIQNNVIAHSADAGVECAGDATLRNRISQNSIFGSGKLGIDLVGGAESWYGMTSNHLTALNGPNKLQNHPVITSTSQAAGLITVTGYLEATQTGTYTVEFFANEVGGAHGYGEGQTYLASLPVSASQVGQVQFTASLSAPDTAWSCIAATATDTLGNTSEFSYAMGCGNTLSSLTVQVTSQYHGLCTPAVGVHPCDPDSTVALVAAPLPGYSFDRWYGEVANPNAPNTTVIMNEPKTVLAMFTSALAKAKRLANNASVTGIVGVVTKVVSPSEFYMEAPDRSCGIRVYKMSHMLEPGTQVSVTGTMMTLGSGEHYLRGTTATPSGTGSIEPLVLANRSIGGGDWYFNPTNGAGQRAVQEFRLVQVGDEWVRTQVFATGLNNIGLLIKTTGKVIFVDPARMFFYIDDGSNLDDNSGHAGVKVLGSAPAPSPVPPDWDPVGHEVIVTGISSCYRVTTPVVGIYRQILATAVTVAD